MPGGIQFILLLVLHSCTVFLVRARWDRALPVTTISAFRSINFRLLERLSNDPDGSVMVPIDVLFKIVGVTSQYLKRLEHNLRRLNNREKIVDFLHLLIEY